jgi:hypothetical protein
MVSSFFYHKGALLFDWYILTQAQYDHISDVLSSAGVLFFTDLGQKAHPLMYDSYQFIFSSFDEEDVTKMRSLERNEPCQCSPWMS